jgi:hypothetical protein
MHAQAIALLHAVEALPAEVSPFDEKRGVRLFVGEAPMIRDWMHN